MNTPWTVLLCKFSDNASEPFESPPLKEAEVHARGTETHRSSGR